MFFSCGARTSQLSLLSLVMADNDAPRLRPFTAVAHVFFHAALNVDPFEPHEFTDQDDAAAADWQQVAGRKLTKMCRAGIPEYFRGGVWSKVMSPTMDEAGTPSHKVSHSFLHLVPCVHVFIYVLVFFIPAEWQ